MNNFFSATTVNSKCVWFQPSPTQLCSSGASRSWELQPEGVQGSFAHHTPRAGANPNMQPRSYPSLRITSCCCIPPLGEWNQQEHLGEASCGSWRCGNRNVHEERETPSDTPIVSSQNFFRSTTSYLHAVFPAGWLGSFSWLNCPPGSWFETRPARASQDSLLVGAEAGGRARRKITIIPL